MLARAGFDFDLDFLFLDRVGVVVVDNNISGLPENVLSSRSYFAVRSAVVPKGTWGESRGFSSRSVE